MDKELQELKSVLRSLVVSSPAKMDVRSLVRDYRSMIGAPIPLAKYGYRDALAFLKERCSDCFLFQGQPSNPVLTLIVPDTLKHIDKFVKRQKPSALTKMKGKRTSVHIPNKPPKFESSSNRICETFQRSYSSERKPNPSVGKGKYEPPHLRLKSNPETKSRSHSPEVKPKHSPIKENSGPNCTQGTTYGEVKSTNRNNEALSNRHDMYNGTKELNQSPPTIKQDSKANAYSPSEENGSVSKFMKKRLSGLYDSAVYLNSEECSEPDRAYSKEDDDSGRQTSSSCTKKAEMVKVMNEVFELIQDNEHGVLCADVLRLYRERYGRDLQLLRVGHHNINSLLCELEPRVAFAPDVGGVRVHDARAPPPPRALPVSRAVPLVRAQPPRPPPVDPDDALPGVDFAPDVFPEDCMHFMQSIPALPLDDVTSGCMIEVSVGEVYSPSHFWLQRVGPEYSQAMDQLMDEMTEYYTSGEGRSRSLAWGAVRVGHYCASLYDRDWHRALIVKLVDSDTVKVRHVDYGTVDSVPAASLKPLLRQWGSLPAQAVRARLAGLRPCAGGRRWPRSAAAAFLHLVRDMRFIANVVAVDREEETIETLLIDTRGEDDVCVSIELIRGGHADPRPDSALRSGESYLFPVFEALESGATLNYAEIHRYLAAGISLDYVDAYRLYVPPALPPGVLRPAAAPPAAGLARLRLDSSPAPTPAHTSPASVTPTEAHAVSPEPTHAESVASVRAVFPTPTREMLSSHSTLNTRVSLISSTPVSAELPISAVTAPSEIRRGGVPLVFPGSPLPEPGSDAPKACPGSDAPHTLLGGTASPTFPGGSVPTYPGYSAGPRFPGGGTPPTFSRPIRGPQPASFNLSGVAVQAAPIDAGFAPQWPAYIPVRGQGQAPAHVPMRGQAPAHVPMRGQAPAQVPMRGQAPAHVPMRGQAPAHVPMRGQAPAQVPMRGQAPAHVPMRGQAPAHVPMKGQAPAHVPLRGQAPAHVPLRGPAPANVPMPGEQVPNSPTTQQPAQIGSLLSLMDSDMMMVLRFLDPEAAYCYSMTVVHRANRPGGAPALLQPNPHMPAPSSLNPQAPEFHLGPRLPRAPR